jgi:general secretion pathway protein G
MHRRRNGFTMVELLMVIAIIAIITAIASVGYVMAINRVRLKRTVNDMRTIAMAWEARAADTNSYAAAGFTYPSTEVTYTDLQKLLVPTYTRALPRYDAWNRPFQFAQATEKDYAIRAAGRDGVFEGPEYTGGEVSDPDCDIIFASGTFVQYPGVALDN